MSLKQRLHQLHTSLKVLQDMQAQGRNPIPFVRRLGELERELEGLKQANVDAAALHRDAQAPDFTGVDAWGKTVSLSGRLAQGPVLLVFYRGNWCPFCNLYLRALQAQLSGWQQAYGLHLIAVSPEAPDQSRQTLERHQLGFELLSDTGLAIARSYGLAYRLPESMQQLYQELELDIRGHNQQTEAHLPVPASYLIAPSGRIVWAHVETDYRQRPDIAVIATELERLSTPNRLDR